MDLKDFAKSRNFTSENEKSCQLNGAQKQAKNIYDKYKDYTKNELIDEITKQIKVQKENGTFNKDALLNALDGISAFIPETNLKQLKELINSIDGQNF